LMADILRRLPDAAFARQGHHNEHGAVTLAELLATYVNHLDHHLKFIRHKRELLGQPLLSPPTTSKTPTDIPPAPPGRSGS
ncbi:MAG: hypothetical protein WDZ48_06290, partial [Pirellulales bacterium]